MTTLTEPRSFIIVFTYKQENSLLTHKLKINLVAFIAALSKLILVNTFQISLQSVFETA